MPTSDAKGRRVRTVFVRLLVTLAAIVAVDVALCYALEPYAGSTELMWSEYRKATSLDTVIVGSSVAGYGISPQVLDERLGTSSFNMGTPGQSLHDSLTSIQCATEEHGIRRVILGIGYETILEYPAINSSVVYTQSKCVGESLPQMARDVWSLVSYPYYFSRIYSLSCAFPWTYDHVDVTPEAISANIARRQSMDVLTAAEAYAEAIEDEGWGYWGQGYDGYERVFPMSHQQNMVFASHTADSPIIEDTMESLAELCAWCEGAGIELYVIAGSYIPSALMEYGDAYRTGMEGVRQVVEATGAHYLDLNMVGRDRLDLRRAHFMNAVHLNHDGAQVATETLASFIADVEAGTDVSGFALPYDEASWQEVLSSVPFVDAVNYASARNEDGTVYVETTVNTGADVDVLIQIELDEGSDGTFEVVRPWDAEPTCTFPVADPDSATIRILARAATDAGSEACGVQGRI